MSDKVQYRRWSDHLTRTRPLVTAQQPDHLYRPRDVMTVADRAAYADTAYHLYMQEKIAHNRTREQAREDREHVAVLLGVQEMYINRLEQALQGVRAVLDPLVCSDPLNPICGALQVVLDSVNLALEQKP